MINEFYPKSVIKASLGSFEYKLSILTRIRQGSMANHEVLDRSGVDVKEDSEVHIKKKFFANSSQSNARKAIKREGINHPWENESCKNEITPAIIQKKKKLKIYVKEAEKFRLVWFIKTPTFKVAFGKNGILTKANPSIFNDGAAVRALGSQAKAQILGLKPTANFLGYDKEITNPFWFTTTPALAIPKALKNSRISAFKVDYCDKNEAFVLVAHANQKLHNLPM